MPVSSKTNSSQAKNRNRLPAFQRHPRNCWYAAAGATEIADKPLGREILGERIVLFRDAEGKVAAARDACPHRGYPLSDSYLKDGILQCAYHGIKFDGSGKCVEIPTNPTAKITNAMCLQTYTVIERPLWVWIWLGDPELADPALIPGYDNETNEQYFHHFLSPVGPHLGNLHLIRENLCDITHVDFLHSGTLDPSVNSFNSDTGRQPDRVDDRTVIQSRDLPVFEADANSGIALNLEPGRKYYFKHAITHHIPGMCVVSHRFYPSENVIDSENPGPVASEVIVTIGLTPANDREFYHMLALTTSLPQTKPLQDSWLGVVNEDVVAVKKLQTYFEQHWDDAVEVSIPSDNFGLLVRRLLSKMVKDEELDDRGSESEALTIAAVK